MVTYDFYKNVYMGSALSESAFAEAAARAEDYPCMLERTCRIVPYGADSRSMAVCGMAETWAVRQKRQQVKSASVGGVSVSYESQVPCQRAMLHSAKVYLDICRGVG